MKTAKKVLASLLSVAIICTMGMSAFATDITTAGSDGSSDLILTVEGACFSVTVPMGLPVTVDANGEVTTANDVKIVNKSHGQVQVTNVVIDGANEWTMTAYSTDMTKEKVGTKKLGYKINNDTTGLDGVMSFTQDNFPVMDGKNDSDSDELPIIYDAKLPAQKTAINGDKIADVTFTICWYEADGTTSSGGNPSSSNIVNIGGQDIDTSTLKNDEVVCPNCGEVNSVGDVPSGSEPECEAHCGACIGIAICDDCGRIQSYTSEDLPDINNMTGEEIEAVMGPNGGFILTKACIFCGGTIESN